MAPTPPSAQKTVSIHPTDSNPASLHPGRAQQTLANGPALSDTLKSLAPRNLHTTTELFGRASRDSGKLSNCWSSL